MHLSRVLIIITIILCVGSIMTQNLEELYVFEKLSNRGDHSLREFTCMSKDNDAALIWNYDLETNETIDHFKNFEPTKPTPTSENFNECAIWESKDCLVSWNVEKRWTIVNSLVKPMSPIIDYRWEGFTEYNLNHVTGEEKYAIVPGLPNSLNGTLVFSVRGIRDIVIRLCGNDNSTISSCLLIRIMVEGTNSIIETCISNITSDNEQTENQICEDVENVTHETAILDAYEWRTFRLQWISNEKIIKLFYDIEEKAFFDSIPIAEEWDSVSNISVTSETAASLKFHIYDYFLETRENTILQTLRFNHSEKNFCINILVSLCPDCQLNVRLLNGTDKQTNTMVRKRIFGSEQFIINGLRTWRSIKLNVTLQKSFVALRITSVLNKDDSTDVWWAIGNLHLCESNDDVRESTIKMPVSNVTSDVAPEIKCQKLVHSKIIIADLTTCKPFNDTTQLRKLIQKGITPCSPEYQHFNGIDCDSYNCICYQGFGKTDGKDCFNVVQGKRNITLIEGFNSTICSMKNSTMVVFQKNKRLKEQICLTLPCGYNEALNSYTQYNMQVNLPDGTTFFNIKIQTPESAPGMVRDLTIEPVFANNVTGEWKSPNETNGRIRNYTVTIQRIKLFGCENFNISSPPESKQEKTVNGTTASFNGLHPYAQYNFTVIANTVEAGPALSKVFNTAQLDIPTTNVSHLRLIHGQSHLAWDGPESCTLITGSVKTVNLKFSGISDWAKNFNYTDTTKRSMYDLTNRKLLPYTQYKVSVYITREYDGSINPDNFQELYWMTAPDAPPRVENILLYEVDAEEKTASIKWDPPYPAYGVIESYEVSIMNENITNGKWSIKALDEKLNCIPFQNYVCIENVTLPSNISIESEFTLQVFARNINVTADGAENSKVFKLNDSYEKEVNQPRNISVIPQSYGIIKLKWMHPLLSPTKIVRFRIHVNFLGTNLTMNERIENQTFNYHVNKKQESYNEKLYLLTSTKYCIKIEAVDHRNRSSNATSINVSLPGGVDFSKKKNLTINMKSNGKLVEFEVPSIVNSTRNTMLVVTVHGIKICKPKSSGNLTSYNKEANTGYEWIAAMYQVNSSEPVTLTFNVDQHYIVEENCSFRLYENYQFVIILNDSSMKPISLESEEFNFTNEERLEIEKSNTIWYAFILIPIMCPAVLYIWFWKCRKTRMEPSNTLELSLWSDMTSSNDWISPCTIQKASPMVVSRIARVSTVEKIQPHFYSVGVNEFEEYVREALASRLLESQYEILSKGLSKSCEYGYLPVNRRKNRFTHILPYKNSQVALDEMINLYTDDENRIILERTLDDPNSDYINASYIQGRRKAKAYIATQGPKRDEDTKTNTVPDFWRMVWQENVHIICMLTKVIEDGEKKCEQYWPEIGKSVQYGNAVVLNTDQQVFVDYTIRTFHLMCREGKREIKHFHYTEWPDHGVPMYIQSLVTFLKKLLVTPVGKGPIVVHSCAGIGRTGTLIVCDISLRQAIKERMINIPTMIQKIRRNRINMVDNVQQYVLAHLVIAECIIAQRTQIPCNYQLREKIDQLRKQLPSDVRRLKRLVWQDKELHAMATRPPITVDPTPNRRWVSNDDNLAELSLPSVPHSSSNSFHVVSVGGVERKKRYLATRLPSPCILPDLWSLIAEKEIELIIVLQCPDTKDPKYCDIVPDECGAPHFNHIQLEVKSTLEDGEYFTKKKFLVTDTSQAEARGQPVTILTCKGWTCGTNEPPRTVEKLVSLWMASEKVQRRESPTLVICRDGVTSCGLYLALSFLLDRMRLEGQCDVISAVRAIRRFEPNFVRSLKQFEYLYDAAINYSAYFETYANFS